MFFHRTVFSAFDITGTARLDADELDKCVAGDGHQLLWWF